MKIFGDEFKWTELVQTIAASVAILGGIAGFYKLFENDQALQAQIQSLQTLAEQSIIQNAALNEQIRLSNLSIALDSAKRSQEIAPIILIEREMISFGETGITKCKLYAILKNTGGPATNIKIKPLTSFKLEKTTHTNYLVRDGWLFLKIEGNCEQIKLTVYYSDIDDNRYSQYFDFIDGDYFVSNEPIRLE